MENNTSTFFSWIDNLSPGWKHAAAAVVIGGATAVAEYVTLGPAGVNGSSILTAALVAYGSSFTYQSLLLRLEQIFGVGPANGNTPPPSQSKITLTISPLNATIGQTVTYSVTGAVPNGTFKLYDESDSAVTGSYPTDSNGNGSFSATLSVQGVIGDELRVDGQVVLYAQDSAGNQSAPVTLT